MLHVNFNTYGNYTTESVYQWDLNRDLIISGLDLSVSPEVHFTNANMSRAIARQSELKDGYVKVKIPNSLLQEPLTIKAYLGIYEEDVFKVIEVVEIPVIAKARPEDYAIENTDEEIYSFKALENQIANIIAHNNDTEGNTELVDIRTDHKGVVHNSAGASVRAQTRGALKEIDDLREYLENAPSGAVATWDNLPGKPFYETAERATVSESANVTFDPGNGDYSYGFLSDFKTDLVAVGDIAVIVFNDNEYECEVKETTTGMLYFGTTTVDDIMNETVDSHIDFPVVVVLDFMGTLLYITDGYPTANVAVYIKKQTVKQLDEKFIPNTIARVSDIVESGNLSADDMAKLALIPTYCGYFRISAGETASIYRYLKPSVLSENSDYAVDIPPIFFYGVGRYVDSNGTHHIISPLKVEGVGTPILSDDGTCSIAYLLHAEIDEPLDYTLYVYVYSSHEYEPQM